MTDENSQVSGEIVLSEDAQSFAGVTAYVRIEDVTRADAPALLVVEHVIHSLAHIQGRETRLPFTLPRTRAAPRGRYSMRIHIDVDGDGQISRGDFVSIESYPVLGTGHSGWASIRVVPVR